MNTKQRTAKALLEEKGIRPTFQRVAILEHMMGNMTHPTVEQVYSELAPGVPTLSKTTVYNTLQMFSDKDLVRVLNIDPSEIRYDGEACVHHHFYCGTCGSIIDIPVNCATAQRQEVDGHRIDEVHGYFKGTCKKCIKKGGKR